MKYSPRLLAIAVSVLCGLAACSREDRATIDSAAGSVESATRAAFSVIDVDMGRHIAADSTIVDKTDNFASSDTVYATVHTSGTATSSAVVGRWTFEDGSVVHEDTNTVTTSGTARTVFSLVKPAGLAKGRYTLRVLVDGKEVRSKDVTVQ